MSLTDNVSKCFRRRTVLAVFWAIGFLVCVSAWIHGINGTTGTSPHYEPGGMGTGPEDRGIRFYFDWVRNNIGRYVYPRHIK